MFAAAPFTWFAAWAEAFGAAVSGLGVSGFGVSGLSSAQSAGPILYAGQDGFTLRSAAGAAHFLPYSDDTARAPATVSAVVLRLTAPDGIIRPLATPASSAADIKDIAALNMDRLAPIPPAQAVWTIGAVRRVDSNVVADVQIASRARLMALKEAAEKKGFSITAADVEDTTTPHASVSANLLGAHRAPSRAAGSALAALVVLMFGLGLIGWLAPPAPGAAGRAQAAETAATPPLTTLLAAAAGALPDDAALTRLVRDQSGVRFEGQANAPEDLIDVINAAGPFRNARLIAPPERAPGGATARFVITADLR